MYAIPETVRAVIFDLNGTMVRDGAFQQLAFERLFANHGVALDEKTYQQKAANRLNREIWPAVLGRPVTAPEAGALRNEKEALYEEAYEGKVQEVEGLTEFVASLRARGLKLGVATTAFRDSAAYILEALGLQDAFDAVVTGDQVSHGKPDPEIYRVALQRLGVGADEAVAFEDSPQGIRAAVAAGIKTVAVLGDYSAGDVEGLGAVASVKDFRLS